MRYRYFMEIAMKIKNLDDFRFFLLFLLNEYTYVELESDLHV